MQITTHSADETQALGQRLAKRLLPGDVIAYFGDLGAGKTALTRGIAQGLGVTDLVTSPTYTIVNEYLTGRIPLFHFDMYRLGSSDWHLNPLRRQPVRRCCPTAACLRNICRIPARPTAER